MMLVGSSNELLSVFPLFVEFVHLSTCWEAALQLSYFLENIGAIS